MDKFKTLILSFLCSATSFEAQCDPKVANNIITGCAPAEVVFNAPANVSAAWVIGTTTLNGTTVTYIFPTPAVYIVTLTTVAGTCVGTATLAVNVVTGPANGCTTTIQGLQSVSNEFEFSIIPNPTAGDLIISISGLTPADQTVYVITDNQGQNIREEELNSKFISTSDLAPGLYFIHLKTQFGTVTKKFVRSD
jgi:hypothetical protein